MSLINLFGFTLAAGMVLTRLAMIVWGERWRRVEAVACGGERHPGWFYVLSVLVTGAVLAGSAGLRVDRRRRS